MRTASTAGRLAMVVALTATTVMTIASVSGQAPAASGDDTTRAIRELTAEVRGLRTVIERTADSQLQGQILGLYLNLQQSRVTQASARLDGARRELEGITGRTREIAQQLTNLESLLPQETDPTRRRAMESEQRALRQESEQLAAQEQQVRAREGEAYQAQQSEEARWTDLIARLEQLLKK